MKILSVGSLFSGIGGIELGLERTGGFRTIWNCEIDEYASAILRKHWPNVPNIGDITKVDWNGIEKPDVLCGGFPCQDISVAGKGKGIKEGTRSGLWFHYAKAIRILRPKYALIENVSALPKRGLHIVLAGIAESGYDAVWFPLRASDVGAPHRRERIFIIAYSSSRGCDARGDNREGRHILSAQVGKIEENKQERNGRKFGVGKNVDVSNTFSFGYRGRNKEELGEKENAPEVQGRGFSVISSYGWGERIQRCRERKIRRFPEFSWCENVRKVEDFKGRPDIPEPLVRGKSNGVSNRMDRIKCLGNAVVPACAQIVGEMILEMDGGIV